MIRILRISSLSDVSVFYQLRLEKVRFVMGIIKFGITERGDIAFDDGWINPVRNGDVSAAILISKGMPTPSGKETMLAMKDRLIFHATTTGFGGTILEPNVKPAKDRLKEVADFCKVGFPESHVVIRVDPMIPTAKRNPSGRSRRCRGLQTRLQAFSLFLDGRVRSCKRPFHQGGTPSPTLHPGSRPRTCSWLRGRVLPEIRSPWLQVRILRRNKPPSGWLRFEARFSYLRPRSGRSLRQESAACCLSLLRKQDGASQS